MSLLGGLVEEPHETELCPSTRLIRSNWFARHLWALQALAAAVGLYFAA